MKKRLGIESSGHLQHHLSKLGNLVKVDENGRYCLSENGRDALFAVQTVERATSGATEAEKISLIGSGKLVTKGTGRWLLFFALLLLMAFVWLQIASAHSPHFLLLMFSSFVFLVAGTLLALWTSARCPEKRLCLTVATVFVTATLLVAISGAQWSRGGVWHWGIKATPETFVLSIANKGGNYYGAHSETLYSADYAVAYATVRPDYPSLSINVSTPVNLKGRILIFLIFKPYQVMRGRAIFDEPIEFNESSTFARYRPYVGIGWGDFRTRFEGYELEFLLRLDLDGPETAPPSLNFTIDTTNFTIYVDDFAVDSSLQSGLSTTISGTFAGINTYTPGKHLARYIAKKQSKEKTT